MLKLKQVIDYLFWKRTWFRAIFILFGVLPIGITILFCWCKIIKFDTSSMFCLGLYFILFGIGLLDIDNVDSPPNPFKKQPQ